MVTRDINICINDEIFPCPIEWTINDTKEFIRDAFCLGGGYLALDSIPLATGSIFHHHHHQQQQQQYL